MAAVNKDGLPPALQAPRLGWFPYRRLRSTFDHAQVYPTPSNSSTHSDTLDNNRHKFTMGAQGLIAVGVPPQPLWLLYIKIAILVLSLVVLAISAYALSLGPYGAGGLNIFVVRTPVALPATCQV
jgi:hypothetical protein